MNDYLRYCFSVLIFVFAYGILHSQQSILTGRITDSATGSPLTGAHIVVEGTKSGGVSDYNGNFRISLDVPGEYSVTATYIGYESHILRVQITSGQVINRDITLQPKLYLAEQAVITASRVQVSRNLTPFTVSVIDRESLESSGESNLLPVIGRMVPGVFVTERGVTGFGVGDGAGGGISIRGVGGNPNTQVLVLVDGHPQFMGIFGHPLPDTYITTDAEKVEVIRGPASVIYGSNAMGGVINVITRETTEDGVTLNANAGYGMFNTFKVNGNAGFRKNKFQAFISYNHDRTEGHRENSDFNIHNGYAKISYDINAHFRVWGDFSLAHYSSTNPGPVGSPDTTFQEPSHWQDIWRSFASVALENAYEKSSGAAKFYFNYGEHQIWDGFLSYDQNFGLNLYQALKLFRGNTVTVGYDLASYGGSAKNTLPEVPVTFADTSIMENAAYAFIQQLLLEKLTFTAGIRYQYHELYQSAWIPHFGASFMFSENTSFRANVSKGFRSPTIRELFLFRPANPELDPESMWNYEAGVIKKFLDQKLALDLTGFYSKGINLIETVGMFPDIQNRNTGEFENFGIEFQGRYFILKHIDMLANYTWLHTDTPVTGAPEHMVYMEGNYRLKNLAFRLSGQYINQLVTATSPVKMESYLNLSARIAYTYDDFITFYLDGANLLNQSYEIIYGYPMPGISVFGGISVKWSSRKKS